MKILMVQRFDLVNISCARRVLAMAQELTRRGHQVILTNFPHPERRKEQPNLLSRLPEEISYLDLDRSGRKLLRNRARVHEVARDCHLLHLWKCYPDAAIPCLWTAFRLRKPVHYDWDDYETGISKELTGSDFVSGVVSLWEQTVPRLADTVSVASAALKEKALACGVLPERLWDTPVGADLEQFQPASEEPSGPPCLVYVGQLEVAAFAELAVHAFSLLARRHPTVQMVIVGGGRHLERVGAQVKRLQLERRVRLTGYISAHAIAGILKQATVALAPFKDNQITRCKSPLKIVEYLASGLPVVASRVGEVPKMLEGCGITVPPDSADALAEAVRLLLDHPERRQAMRKQARRRAEKVYNWSRTVDNLEAAYTRAIELQKKS